VEKGFVLKFNQAVSIGGEGWYQNGLFFDISAQGIKSEDFKV
jgi:hypothetical protein